MISFDTPPICNVIEILLRDMNTGGNILFKGKQLTKKLLPDIKPRALKSDAEKSLRTRTNAEVFTPSHVVKFMVDKLDELDNNKLDSRWLEITCGEAPFITNRYDAESGELIPAERRVGVLDRKLRIAKNFEEARRAVQSVYGYELQGDSLLIARANVLLTFAEAVKNFSESDLAEVAEIIAWNFFQLDGTQDNGMFGTQIIDWSNNGKIYTFGGYSMKKFGLVIGNPPYQDDTTGGNKTFAPPVYDIIMEEAHKIGEKVELITPARFLFNAGATHKDFNQRMLNDPHFKVLDYAPDASKYFKNVDIEGGVAITLHDETKDFGAIGTFIEFDELKTIHQKVCVDNPDFKPLSDIIYSRKIYRLTEKFYEENPNAPTYLKDSNNYTIGTNAFVEMREYFLDDKPDDGNEYVKIFGKEGTERVYKFIRRDYVNAPMPLNKFKVFVPKANGASGKLSEEPARIISKPAIGEAFVGATETFITVGAFDTFAEAEACLKYINDKFARVMLGILKITQDNTADKWAKVPMQDFTSASDIDWSGNIDAQLYRKYNLDDTEIDFIEKHVKEMI